ncbi:MAG: bifunctional UDP-3-O-[3-hydroxymyristoyl] N-acetylglucosamine deacetylase/3-hydroxyacyl-ACP dehydratase [Bacteroidetes bacterium]|jgi:UDP-3-O-[3-hydroxymyristoyl] N-acetylglucosamine deacetylase/3-hydroxyacyl-[acyl-carrier-protein] dehydratase|nr:bifunctional UDP-3-O-[3-hydroxymyristoyl] N-acetylglucosamine deacetylase/3-hydroxyacyl-ACP dehydratase [Bacteroidota bacterium]
MSQKQKTLAKSFTISGSGLHTGVDVDLTFNPAPENHGYKFKRVDLDNQPVIRALAENVTDTSRGTTLEENGCSVATVEHVLASLYGLGIDNVMLEINGPEMPIIDGSAKPFVDKINEAGIQEQQEDKVYFELSEKMIFCDKEKGIEIIAFPDDEFSIDVKIDYNSKVLGYQYASIKSLDEFQDAIAPCRTFAFLHEIEFLAKNNLIKGGDLSNAIVIMDMEMSQEELDHLADLFNKPKIKARPEGILNNVELAFQNEPARHKLLDVIGDLALTGMPLKAKIVATKPGHYANTEFGKSIRKIIKKQFGKPRAPKYDPTIPPIFDVLEVQRRIPHRAPFLLVDKVLSMDEWTVVGVKNVTMNEAYFTGHFPEEPIMPGVLQIEAMAQVGAILLTSFVEDRENYLTYFLKIENIKFKYKVVPGDTLVIRMILTEPIKRGIAITKGQAFVGDKMVIEGEFMAQLAKKPNV